MDAILGEISRRLTGQWIQIALSGALFLGVGWVALTLGQRHALDHGLLLSRVDALVAGIDGTTALIIRAVLITALGYLVGMTAHMAGSLLRRLWTDRWPPPLHWIEKGIVRLRRAYFGRRWPDRTRELPARYLPARATQVADRIRLAHERVDAEYGAHLGLLWPRLWLMLTPDERGPIELSRAGLDSAAVLAVWGAALVGLGWWWWPAALIGLAVVLLARHRARTAVGALADLAESTVDSQQHVLAERFGVALVEGRISREDFRQINDRLTKGA
ncbi:hypothetical protein [Micromonospora haikouensis]|uniref:hypothetical protein n=1 Tax=Micromonospora haikouensis TaxID=686309 RepID=UPI0033E6E1D5